ncbi:MAG: relaxase/mobilization nuclease, partial [Clostridia bacterium]|nr:relaxase/mobilization nuclease [Clostridia bacterium]
MAVTSVWRIKGNISKVILYVENEDKTRSLETFDNSKKSDGPEDVLSEVLNYVSRNSATEEQVYVSGVKCAPQNAIEAMMKIKRKYNKLGGTTAYHGY